MGLKKKKLTPLLTVFILTIQCSVIYASRKPDLIVTGNTTPFFLYNDSTLGLKYNGYAALLFPIADFHRFSLIFGPAVRYRTVEKTRIDLKTGILIYKTGIDYLAGGEFGFKYNPSPLFTVYNTASYYTAPQTTANYILMNGIAVGVPYQAVSPKIFNYWEAGLNFRVFYNLTRQFGLGTGISIVRIVERHNSVNIQTLYGSGYISDYSIIYNIIETDALIVLYF